MRNFIFWWIAVPSALAFILGFVANVCQTMANRNWGKPEGSSVELSVTSTTSV